jgi:transcriptional regulator with XRE-family HTH domain
MEGELQRIAGINIRAYRRARKVSQEELADALGVHRTYMAESSAGSAISRCARSNASPSAWAWIRCRC